MKFLIITDNFAAPSCELSEEQFQRTLKASIASEEFKVKKEADWLLAQNRFQIRRVEFRKTWKKSKAELAHLLNPEVLHPDQPLDFPHVRESWYVKIVPLSILENAPREIVAKLDAWEDRHNTGEGAQKEIASIEQILRRAERAKEPPSVPIVVKSSTHRTRRHAFPD